MGKKEEGVDVNTYNKINGVSSNAVEKATGKSWNDWVKLLDKEKCADKSHKEIAKLVFEKYVPKSGWWSQMVTVGYEYAKGKRVVGKTETQGYEIGVQKMLYVKKEKLWKFLDSPKGRALWLGKEVEHEMRTVKKGERMRMKWKPNAWKNTSILQITLFCPRNTMEKTNLNFHQEKLNSTKQRNEMRKHWHDVLERIEESLS